MIEPAASVFAEADGRTGHERIGAGPVLLTHVIRYLTICAAVSVQDAHLIDIGRMIVDVWHVEF